MTYGKRFRRRFEYPYTSGIRMLTESCRRHKRYSGLKKHICRICGKGFLHFKDLRRHRPTHSANMLQKPCPVDSCTVATGRLDNLKRHIQNKHPEFDIDAWIAEDPKFTPTQRGKHLVCISLRGSSSLVIANKLVDQIRPVSLSWSR